jgi:hypothetical protein
MISRKFIIEIIQRGQFILVGLKSRPIQTVRAAPFRHGSQDKCWFFVPAEAPNNAASSDRTRLVSRISLIWQSKTSQINPKKL